jgi:hypothetical protein
MVGVAGFLDAGEQAESRADTGAQVEIKAVRLSFKKSLRPIFMDMGASPGLG